MNEKTLNQYHKETIIWLRELEDRAIIFSLYGIWHACGDGFLWDALLISPKQNSDSPYDVAIHHAEGACLDSSVRFFFGRFDPSTAMLHPASPKQPVWKLLAIFNDEDPQFLHQIRVPAGLYWASRMESEEAAPSLRWMPRWMPPLETTWWEENKLKYSCKDRISFNNVVSELPPPYALGMAYLIPHLGFWVTILQLMQCRYLFHPTLLDSIIPAELLNYLYPSNQAYYALYYSYFFFSHGDRHSHSFHLIVSCFRPWIPQPCFKTDFISIKVLLL